MKFFTALGRIPAKLINDTVAAVDALDTIVTRFDGGNESVSLFEILSASYGQQPTDYTCGEFGWTLPTEPRPEPVLGIPIRRISDRYLRAHEVRRDPGTPLPRVTGDDGLFNSPGLPYGVVAWDDFGTEWGYGPLHPDEPGAPDDPVTEENWTYPGGFCGDETDVNAFTRNPENGTDSPGWDGHAEGVWDYFWSPMDPITPPLLTPAFDIRALHGYDSETPGNNLTAIASIIATGQSIGVPEVIRRWMNGKTLVDARMEITLGNMSTETTTATRTSADPDDETIVSTTSPTADSSLILLGRTATAGGYRWTAIAVGVGGSVTSDVTAVVDATPIVAAMLDKASDYDAFCLIAGPAGDFVEPGSGAGVLRAIIPDATLAYDAVLDAWYLSTGKSTRMSYDSIGIGRLAITADWSGVPARSQEWQRWPEQVV